MADGPNVFLDAVILLGGATIAAPLFKKIGLGTVLGYLALGIILGPILNYFRDGESVLHVAELGVVLLLFLVGLELKPSRLWDMRREIFGLGGAQVVISGIVLSAIAWVAYFPVNAAVVVGFGLALSSTAFALQLLEDSGDERTPYGKRTFSILLFQDLAIAPLLVAVPVACCRIDGIYKFRLDTDWNCGEQCCGSSSNWPLRPQPLVWNHRRYRCAGSYDRSSFVHCDCAAVLMQYAGLSMAMGAFIAGVMLAESSYRHELEADIEPFRGILLGLFFIAVGLAVNLEIVWDNIGLILMVVPAALAVKALIIYVLCRVFGSDHNESVKVAFILPQHGEFAFVLFSAAVGVALLSSEESSFLIACVTLSMALTPLSVMFGNLLMGGAAPEQMDEDYEDAEADILMIGFSRMGQITAQTLLAGGCKVTVLDNSANRMRQAERFGFRIYFGDGTRKDVLLAAGIRKAKSVAVCTNDKDTTDHIVDLIASEFPNIKLYVRSYDRGHSLKLLEREGLWQIRETFESALVMGKALLESSGHTVEDAEFIISDVRRRDLDRLKMQMKDGFLAGVETLHSEPVPEPLIQPKKSRNSSDTEFQGNS